MEVRKLYLAWEDPIEHRWMPVGQLTKDDDNMYRFVYTKGARSVSKFENA